MFAAKQDDGLTLALLSGGAAGTWVGCRQAIAGALCTQVQPLVCPSFAEGWLGLNAGMAAAACLFFSTGRSASPGSIRIVLAVWIVASALLGLHRTAAWVGPALALAAVGTGLTTALRTAARAQPILTVSAR